MIITGSLIIVCFMLLLGVSVYVAFGAVLIFIALVGDQSITGYLPTGATGIRSLVLLAIPLFMIAGGIMEKGRIAAPLVALAEMFIGHIKGGLNAASVLACGVFGSISGSANATLTCIGGIMMPHLKKANYPKGQSAALIVSASPLGLLIPPSSSHILYGWVAQQHVLKCFLSTVIPAIILITLLIITNHFGKAHDMFAYRGDVSMLDAIRRDKKLKMIDEMVRDRFGVTVRGMRPGRFSEEVETFLTLYNQAMAETWGYVPMSRSEVVHFGHELKRLLVPELARVAEVDGKPVGCVFGLLDYNPRIKAIDGRLFPFGFLRLLANKQAISRIRLVSTNVLPEYQSWGVGVCLTVDMLKPALAHGVSHCEFSWVLESNDLSRKTIEKGGAIRYKTWRIFEKAV